MSQGASYTNFDGEVLEDGTVKCNCKETARRFVVKKEGNNQGKAFYKCINQGPKECGIFLWEWQLPKYGFKGTPIAAREGGSQNSSQTPSSVKSSPPKRKLSLDEDVTTEDEDDSLMGSPTKQRKTNQKSGKKKIADSDDEYFKDGDDDDFAMINEADYAPKLTPIRPPLPPVRPPKIAEQTADPDPITDFDEARRSPNAKNQPKFNGFSTPLTTPIKAMPMPMSTPSSSVSRTPNGNAPSTPGGLDTGLFDHFLSGLGNALAPALESHAAPLKKELAKAERLLVASKRSIEAKDRIIKDIQTENRELKNKIRILESNSRNY